MEENNGSNGYWNKQESMLQAHCGADPRHGVSALQLACLNQVGMNFGGKGYVNMLFANPFLFILAFHHIFIVEKSVTHVCT